jgi:hypothetical protein
MPARRRMRRWPLHAGHVTRTRVPLRVRVNFALAGGQPLASPIVDCGAFTTIVSTAGDAAPTTSGV